MNNKNEKQLNVFYERSIVMWDEPSRWGHTAILGKTGKGKTATLQTLVELAFQKNEKVIVWDMFRAENSFYGFKEDDEKMLYLNWKAGRSAKKFPLQVLLPIFAKEGVKEYKYSFPSSWTPCKINYKDLTKTELKYLMGSTSEKSEQILDNLPLDAFPTLESLRVKLIQLQNKDDMLLLPDGEGGFADIGDPRIYRTLTRAVSALVKKNIVKTDLADGFEFIDLEKIQEDYKTITAITGRACGSIENFMCLFFNVMSGLIYSRQRQESGTFKPLHIFIPEVSNIAGATSKDQNVVRLMRIILQEARDSGISIYLDSQRPQNIDSSVKGQITKWYLFAMDKDDADYIDSNLVDIPKDYNIFKELPNQRVGECLKIWQGKDNQWKFRKAAHIFPPQSHKKQAYENVVSYHNSQGIKTEKIQDSFEERYAPVFSSQVEGDEDRKLRRKKKKKAEKQELFEGWNESKN